MGSENSAPLAVKSCQVRTIFAPNSIRGMDGLVVCAMGGALCRRGFQPRFVRPSRGLLARSPPPPPSASPSTTGTADGWVACLVLVVLFLSLASRDHRADHRARRKTRHRAQHTCSSAPRHWYPRFCLVSVLPYPGGGGLAEFQGGWVSNHPPPPGWGDFVGALGSIEPVPLLFFFLLLQVPCNMFIYGVFTCHCISRVHAPRP